VNCELGKKREERREKKEERREKFGLGFGV
jgi:hypothetical protein